MPENKSRFEEGPKKDEKPREQQPDRSEGDLGEGWEKEKQQSREIVSKALEKVKKRVEGQ